MDYMMNTMWLDKPVWMWALFLGIVLTLMVLDLGVMNKKNHVIGVKESLWTTAGYMSLATLFGGWVWYELGSQKAIEYYTGYVVELSLAMDNVFVIAMILGFFKIPREYQHRVLFWGILGVLLLRGIMIGVGTAMVQNFHWILLIFAAFLIFTGFKMLVAKEDEGADLATNPVLLFLKKYGRVTSKLHADKFFVRLKDENTGRLATYMTPLMVALILVELADVLFAVDSVPAIFAITTDPYIVFTSNIFAILGLRALYFALSATMARFAYLKYALATLLIFIGGKMLIAEFGLYKMTPLTSLVITLAILTSGVVYSFIKTRKDA
ncbi:MAG: TerC family protein [Alphaproteobacteria bacterium]|nr:MAG: TerC family protein [Alphaproteobacteria bacterium]